jgi:hypothetical protein
MHKPYCLRYNLIIEDNGNEYMEGRTSYVSARNPGSAVRHLIKRTGGLARDIQEPKRA